MMVNRLIIKYFMIDIELLMDRLLRLTDPSIYWMTLVNDKLSKGSSING